MNKWMEVSRLEGGGLHIGIDPQAVPSKTKWHLWRRLTAPVWTRQAKKAVTLTSTRPEAYNYSADIYGIDPQVQSWLHCRRQYNFSLLNWSGGETLRVNTFIDEIIPWHPSLVCTNNLVEEDFVFDGQMEAACVVSILLVDKSII